LQWPPNSPDLNPIESLWGAIKRRLNWGEISTREETIQIIETVWSEFEQASIDSLMGSVANRVTMLKDTQGRTVQSLISAGRTIGSPGYASVMRTPITRNDAADQPLIDLMNSHGRTWKLTSQQLDDFTEGECMNWWLFLFTSRYKQQFGRFGLKFNILGKKGKFSVKIMIIG
jgi:hypothetical protein